MATKQDSRFLDPDQLRYMRERFPGFSNAAEEKGISTFLAEMEDAKARAEVAFRQLEAVMKWHSPVHMTPEMMLINMANFKTIFAWRPAGCDYVGEMVSAYFSSSLTECSPAEFEEVGRMVISAFSEKVFDEKLISYERPEWINYETAKLEFQEYTWERLESLVRSAALDRWKKRSASTLAPDSNSLDENDGLDRAEPARAEALEKKLDAGDGTRKRRGRPTEIPFAAKEAALAIKEAGGTNRAVASKLYNTPYPSVQQVKNVSAILRNYLKSRQTASSSISE